jgi:hypothetical protein
MPQGHRSRGSPQGGQRPAEITTTWTIPCRSTLDHTVVQRRHSWALCLNHGDTHERSTFAEGMLHILDGGDRNDTTAGRIGCLNDGRCTFPLTPRKRGPNEWRNTCFLKSFFANLFERQKHANLLSIPAKALERKTTTKAVSGRTPFADQSTTSFLTATTSVYAP